MGFHPLPESTDGGRNWTSDLIVLQPTAGSADNNAVCDPSVVFSGGYYYLSYTATVQAKGGNNVFVARSKSPAGPFQKWNGHGWGGKPAPVITYKGPRDAYGAGEPSLVVAGSTLYVYYSWLTHDAHGRRIQETRVATAPAAAADWPASLTYRGVALDNSAKPGTDSADIKYVDSYGKFVAVHAAERFTPRSYVQMWESDDGIHFRRSAELRTGLRPHLHNAGISGDRQGHIDITRPQYLGYAYGSNASWGQWNTELHRIQYTGEDAGQAGTPQKAAH